MNLQVFRNQEFGQIRMVEIDGKAFAVAKDVALLLGYSNPRDAILRHCKGVVKHDSFKEGGHQVALVTEGDIYRLVANSKLPSAVKFESWIFDEVLPSIKKNGTYMTDEVIEKVLTDPDTIIQLATRLKEEKVRNQQLASKIEADKPKVVFADAVSVSKTSILIGELAKLMKQNGVEIGQNRLFEWLRENEYLIKRRGTDYNMPTQRSMEMGLFEIKETTINHNDGHTSISKTPKVTGRGQVYFINKFRKDFELRVI